MYFMLYSMFMMIMIMPLFMMSLYMMMKSIFISLELQLLSMPLFNIQINIMMDWMSTMFMFTVITISSMILMFSMFYIPNKEKKYFSLMMIMFITSMMILISSNNLFMILLGWDGLGLSSYILVIYYQNFSSATSGSITILSNRMGDILILLSLGIMSINMNWEFELNKNFPSLVMMFLLIAACSKSAQFPFSAWLPEAMAAPTPISALVHSSTLVTAGVYLLIRIMNNMHPTTMMMLMLISSMTAIYSSISAIWQQDMKKIIALSTLSQIAMMMFAISINSILISFFHLITHAMFKSTMFMCAGMYIHNSSYQDTRNMGMSLTNSPLTNSTLGLTNMALMGIPFTSGFFSKDSIIEKTLSNKMHSMLSMIMLISISLTSMYSIRMLISSSKLWLKCNPNINQNINKYSNSSISMMSPISIILGASMMWILPNQQIIIIPSSFKIMIMMLLLTSIIITTMLKFKMKKYMNMGSMMIMLWFIHNFTTNLFSKQMKMMKTPQKMDLTWQELYGPSMLFHMMKTSSKNKELMLNSTMFTIMIMSILPIMMMN